MTETVADALLGSLEREHERVHLVRDAGTGLQAIVAIHSTVLGPALGGLRLRRYPGGMAEALDDALRLSRAMTLKAATAGLDLGGGKAVILDDGREDLRQARLAVFAAELERLDGAYITAEDVGTTTADMDFLARRTAHVMGRTTHDGIGGDPSPDTARTVLGAMRAALAALGEGDDLRGRSVGVVGLGKVGRPLARWLVEAGADVVAYDPRLSSTDRLARAVGLELVDSVQALLDRELDVLAPCAMGGLVDVERAETLRCRIVCGAANNPLSGHAAAERLAERGILYVPDFLANCGGLLHVDAERRGASAHEVEQALAEARQRTLAVLAEARASGCPPVEVAERHAWDRIAARAPAAAVARAGAVGD